MSTGLDALTKKNIDTWLTGNYDEETKSKIKIYVGDETDKLKITQKVSTKGNKRFVNTSSKWVVFAT